MKTGKYIPLGTYNDVKIGYGTVDFKELKTIYLKFNSWIQPNKEDENFEDLILRTRREIKKIIYDLNNIHFKPQSIVDLDVKTKGIKIEKRSFMNLEITLYVDERFDVKSKETKKIITEMIKLIINNCLSNKNFFNFYKTKK